MRHAFFCAHLRRIQQTTRLLHRHVFRLAYGNLGAIDRRREPRPDTSQPGATFSTGSMIFRGLVHHEVARVETWTPAQTTCSDSSTDVLEQPLVSAPGPRSRSCCRDLRRHLSNPEAFADRLAAGTVPDIGISALVASRPTALALAALAAEAGRHHYLLPKAPNRTFRYFDGLYGHVIRS